MNKILLCAFVIGFGGCMSSGGVRAPATTEGVPFTLVQCRNGETLNVYHDAPGHFVYKFTEYRNGWVRALPDIATSNEAEFFFQTPRITTLKVICVVPQDLGA